MSLELVQGMEDEIKFQHFYLKNSFETFYYFLVQLLYKFAFLSKLAYP